MLFRLVRPVKRTGSRNPQFVRRIPSDVRSKAVGLKLSIPVGDQTQVVVITPRTQSVRLSLRTDNPAEVKSRLAAVDAYLENVWRALREDAPVSLTHRQATALAGELYHAWVNGEGRERAIAMVHTPGVGWQREYGTHVGNAEWQAVLANWEKIGATGEPSDLEKPLGAIVDRLLLAKGIKRVDENTRSIILPAFWQALRDAFETRKRNAEGDYSPDAKSERFPEWTPLQVEKAPTPAAAKVSLKGLVGTWWTEAKAAGRKPSTHESYSNTMAAFVDYLAHDDASRVTRDDVARFKNHRLASINPRTGLPISAKTVKDSDLSALKTVFGWAKANGKMDTNPAEGLTIKLSKPRKLRSKGFTDAEADAVLNAAQRLRRGQEMPKTFAAKRWVPWLCAYTGARVGELAQLRKEDIRRDGKHWIAKITPDAGTVKTNEARDVVLHEHLAELGFTAFVKGAAPGHLFIKLTASGDVSRSLGTVKNRIAEFVRTVVPDKNVAPSHGWRHRFKTVGIEAGIEHRILDAIQGHSPRSAGEGYGEVTIKTQAAAIAKLPRYKVRA
ncbi:MAG: tyrosine-type recombinase/integrase [Xanthobacteraceae bacterium]